MLSNMCGMNIDMNERSPRAPNNSHSDFPGSLGIPREQNLPEAPKDLQVGNSDPNSVGSRTSASGSLHSAALVLTYEHDACTIVFCPYAHFIKGGSD